MDRLAYYIGKGRLTRKKGICLARVREMSDGTYSVVEIWNKEAKKMVNVVSEIGNQMIGKHFGKGGELYDNYNDALDELTRSANDFRKKTLKELGVLEEGMEEYLVDPANGFTSLDIDGVRIVYDVDCALFHIDGHREITSYEPVKCYEKYRKANTAC